MGIRLRPVHTALSTPWQSIRNSSGMGLGWKGDCSASRTERFTYMENKSAQIKSSSIVKVIDGSLLGIFIFMTPLPAQGELTIPLWTIKNALGSILGASQVYILLAVVCIAA